MVRSLTWAAASATAFVDFGRSAARRAKRIRERDVVAPREELHRRFRIAIEKRHESLSVCLDSVVEVTVGPARLRTLESASMGEPPKKVKAGAQRASRWPRKPIMAHVMARAQCALVQAHSGMAKVALTRNVA
jgi:hypothetical protein